ncbi:MAG: hypothetical protein II712_03030 [Erysipelotrichaceae bacterium]|nr:hypothetical protein [Erysipelotrichaceae bacterium]
MKDLPEKDSLPENEALSEGDNHDDNLEKTLSGPETVLGKLRKLMHDIMNEEDDEPEDDILDEVIDDTPLSEEEMNMARYLFVKHRKLTLNEFRAMMKTTHNRTVRILETMEEEGLLYREKALFGDYVSYCYLPSSAAYLPEEDDLFDMVSRAMVKLKDYEWFSSGFLRAFFRVTDGQAADIIRELMKAGVLRTKEYMGDVRYCIRDEDEEEDNEDFEDDDESFNPYKNEGVYSPFKRYSSAGSIGMVSFLKKYVSEKDHEFIKESQDEEFLNSLDEDHFKLIRSLLEKSGCPLIHELTRSFLPLFRMNERTVLKLLYTMEMLCGKDYWQDGNILDRIDGWIGRLEQEEMKEDQVVTSGTVIGVFSLKNDMLGTDEEETILYQIRRDSDGKLIEVLLPDDIADDSITVGTEVSVIEQCVSGEYFVDLEIMED